MTGMNRREVLAYLGGAGAGLGLWRATHNTVIGYGRITGTNVTEQEFDNLLTEQHGFWRTSIEWGETRITVDDGWENLLVDPSEEVAISDRDRLASIESERFQDPVLTELAADLTAIKSGITVEPMSLQSFFETIDPDPVRGLAVHALRGTPRVGSDPEPVAASDLQSFISADPANPEAIIYELATAFREHANYDIPRYLAGAIEDNILLGRRDLREHFEEPDTIEAMLDGATPGLFCTELTIESMRALHAVPAVDQSIPVAAMYLRNSRHKHAYTGFVTLRREDGELRAPMGFADYMYSTLYDDLQATTLFGEGLNAYDTTHRVTEIDWIV